MDNFYSGVQLNCLIWEFLLEANIFVSEHSLFHKNMFIDT